MKRILVIATLLALCIGMAAQDESDKSGSKMGGGDVSSALQNMEHKWAAASQKGDCETVANMLSDKWVTTGADGKLQTKAEWMNDCKKTKLTQSEVSDMQVKQISKDTAVVTGKWRGNGTSPDGKSVGGPEQWTDVFVKEGGNWKCVASQATKIASDQSQSAQQ